MNREGDSLYEFGPFRLDPEEHMLLRDVTPVSLRPKEFAVLLALVETPGQSEQAI
jgi:DNA-binding response OmpR family regulator